MTIRIIGRRDAERRHRARHRRPGLLINERAGIVNPAPRGRCWAAIRASLRCIPATTGWHSRAGAGALAAARALVIWLNTNQYASGLALSLFGAGFSAFAGIKYTQQKLGDRPRFEIPGLADIPFVGPALFKHHPIVYLTVLGTVALAWFLYRSRGGLVLRAIGESPPRRTRSAIRCGSSASRPWWPAARCADWPAPTSR
jgi:simple sugar transport system permease protein